MRLISRIIVALGALVLIPVAQAQLQDRGSGMAYDPRFNVTWLTDMNYSATSGYDDDGRMSWDRAVEWAGQLEYGGFSDWRLPNAENLIYGGSDPRNNELWHLFFVELGSTPGPNGPYAEVAVPSPYATQNLALFSNFLADVNSNFVPYTYSWLSYSGNAIVPDYVVSTFREAYLLDSRSSGRQGLDSLFWSSTSSGRPETRTIALRDGDVAISPIPEPSTYALMLAGLAAVGYMARRRKMVRPRRA